MAITNRFYLTLDAEDKDLLFRAANLVGMTAADFVRNAAKEKAHFCSNRNHASRFQDMIF